MIMASKCIYMVTHLVMGKTTSKKALSCAHTQKCKSQASKELDRPELVCECTTCIHECLTKNST